MLAPTPRPRNSQLGATTAQAGSRGKSTVTKRARCLPARGRIAFSGEKGARLARRPARGARVDMRSPALRQARAVKQTTPMTTTTHTTSRAAERGVPNAASPMSEPAFPVGLSLLLALFAVLGVTIAFVYYLAAQMPT